jgi:hypothetical protein
MLAASSAHANDTNGGLIVRAIDLRARNGVAGGIGAGVDAALFPWSGTKYMDCPSGCIQGPYQPVYFAVGAFATHSLGSDSDTRRDLYGLRASIGLGKGPTDWFIPFGAVSSARTDLAAWTISVADTDTDGAAVQAFLVTA